MILEAGGPKTGKPSRAPEDRLRIGWRVARYLEVAKDTPGLLCLEG